MRRRPTAAARIAVLALGPLLMAQAPGETCGEDAMLVFDASGSMRQQIERASKIDIARQAAADVLPDMTRHRAVGLITYGGVPAPTCSGIHLRLAPTIDSAGMILGELQMLEPAGDTPLTQAVWFAAASLASARPRGTVVLVTDGLESCGQDPCALGAHIAKTLPGIKVHVIGFGLASTAEARIACLSKATGGVFSLVGTYEELRDALRHSLSCPRISAPLHDRPGGRRLALSSGPIAP